MNIAIIIRRLNIKGGAQKQALELANFLRKFNHNVIFYTFDHDEEQCFEDLKKFKVVSLRAAEKSRNPIYFLRENNNSYNLSKKISSDTDILNPHGEGSYKVAYFYKKFVKNVRSVWMMNDMPTKIASYERMRLVSPNHKMSFIKRLLNTLQDYIDINKFIRAQDKIVVLDSRDRDWVERYFNMKAEVVRSGLNIVDYDFVSHQIHSPIRLVTTGIFLRHRRFEDTIRAMSELKKRGVEVTLTIIGAISADPIYAREIKNLVGERMLTDRVYFKDAVTGDEMKKIYAESDIFVFACHMQSWGLAVFEAMAAGLPVIVSKSAGASEILEDKVTALLIQPLDPNDIAEKIEFLASDLKLYQDLRTNGRKFVEENVSWHRYGTTMLNYFSHP